MKLKLRTKLIISYSLLSLFIIAALFFATDWVVSRQFQNHIIKQREAAGEDIVQAVTKEFTQPRPHPRVLKEIGEYALRQNIIIHIDYTDKATDSKHKSSDDDHKKLREKSNRERPAWGNISRKIISDLGKDKVSNVERTYPLLFEGKKVALLTLIFPTQLKDADDYFMDLLSNVLLQIALVFLVIAVIFGIYMANRISRPLKTVIGQTRLVEQGDYTTHIAYQSGTTEIDELISSVNNLTRALERGQQTKQRLARDYAHEVRTPLAVVQSNLEGMIDGVLTTTPERLESCRLEILRLTRMIEQIDKLVEIENRPEHLHKQSLRLDELIRQKAAAFEAKCLSKNIHLQLNLEPLTINADPDKLSQVIVNLLINALKFTPEGGQITLETENQQEQITFSVEDTGIGIDPEDLPFVFEHLYCADKSRHRDGINGSGIGLSVVLAIIRAHGGTATVTSVKDRGSKFIITLPK